MIESRLVSRELIAFLLLTFVGCTFVFNSYPFMYPGYDMWWHMGSIEFAHLSSNGAQGRFYWHAFWGWLLPELNIHGIFDRALIIHRVQLSLTALMVGASGYLALRAAFHKTAATRAELLLCALLGVLVWFLMHGTWSMAIGGGPDSYALMPWISWYSLNYQISLPFTLLASAALIYAVSMPLGMAQRVLMWLLCAATIAVAAVIHAAEVPYFLFSAVLVGALYIRGRRAALLLSALVLAGVIFVSAALRFSDRVPELIHVLLRGEWRLLWSNVNEYGHALVDLKLNRSLTGWNTLTSASFGLLVLSILVARQSLQSVEMRPMVFVLATGLMPLALLWKWSAGLLAMVTYLYVAWRFAFASFLFLGIPVFLVVVRLYFGRRMGLSTQMALTLVVALVVASYSRWADPAHVVLRMSSSLTKSLDSEKMHYGLLPEEQRGLDLMYSKLVALNLDVALCVDVFSANYLFFLKGYRNVYLPANLEMLPTVEHQNASCQFPRDGGDLRKLGIPQPPWRFDLVQTLAE
jgi:hypothetical protein